MSNQDLLEETTNKPSTLERSSSEKLKFPLPCIFPEHSILYNWEFDDFPKEIKLTIHCPTTQFDSSLIHAELFNENSDIKVWYERELPIVWGHLTAKLSKITTKIDDDAFIITGIKFEENHWDFVCSDFFGGMKNQDLSYYEADPLTLFIIFHIYASDPQLKNQSTKILDQLLSLQYLPAIRYAGQSICTNASNMENLQFGLSILLIGSETYQDTICMLLAGTFLITKFGNFDEGKRMLLHGGELGDDECYLNLGLFLSPYSDLSQGDTNIKEALECFQRALVINDKNYTAMNELAKIYFYGGKDIPRNIIESRRLAEIVKQNFSEFEKPFDPDIQIQPEITNRKKTLFHTGIVTLCVSGLVTLGFYIYKKFSKKQ